MIVFTIDAESESRMRRVLQVVIVKILDVKKSRVRVGVEQKSSQSQNRL